MSEYIPSENQGLRYMSWPSPANFIECDGCGKDKPREQIEEVRLFIGGELHYLPKCLSCRTEDAECAAADLAATASLKVQLEALAGKVCGMSLHDAAAALNAVALDFQKVA